VERLATVDKVDWIVGLYATGFNVAAVPTFAKLGYPLIRWPASPNSDRNW